VIMRAPSSNAFSNAAPVAGGGGDPKQASNS